MPFELVSYSEDYRDAVAALVHRLDRWFEPDAFRLISAELRADTTLLAIDETDQVIGFLIVLIEDEQAGRISWAGVDPAWHRRGVGRAMIEAIAEEAAQAGLTRLVVETISDQVDYEPYERTRAFYGGMGFQPYHEWGDKAGNGLLTTDWQMILSPESTTTVAGV
jgi:ribosomal protein S18 acetylase RimI-like enzyme